MGWDKIYYSNGAYKEMRIEYPFLYIIERDQKQCFWANSTANQHWCCYKEMDVGKIVKRGIQDGRIIVIERVIGDQWMKDNGFGELAIVAKSQRQHQNVNYMESWRNKTDANLRKLFGF